ncbi:MAG: methionyl-tRNA formyltransferase [Actinomycetota bacterium]
MRLVFLGNDPWSVPSLEALAADPGLDVALAITNPARPAGRGSRLTSTAVAEAARRLDLPILEVDGVRAGPGLRAIHRAAPDALVVVAYGELLTPEVLAVPELGAVNVHFSLLPRWRGASPVQHALLAGDSRTGVTITLMDAGLDTGPTLAEVATDVGSADDAGSLGARLAAAGAELLTRTLPDVASGTARPSPQASEGVTYAPKLGPGDRRISWAETASQVIARVRAFAPEPGATTTFRNTPLKVLEVGGLDHDAEGETDQPGTVVVVDNDEPRITTGRGRVRLVVVAPAGRKRMHGDEWARGARVQPGERLG